MQFSAGYPAPDPKNEVTIIGATRLALGASVFLLYAIRASDPVTLASAAALIFAITFLVTTIPAVRSAQLNPAKALRSE